MEYVLTTSKLTKKYHNFVALNGVSMHIPKGSIYGFVGRNGAGKTTLIRLICGLQEPTKGSYQIYGAKHFKPSIKKARRRMGAIVESPAFYHDMSAEENLKQQCLLLGVPSYDAVPKLLKMVGLDHVGNKKARNFSLGMKQRLAIAIALVGNPDFLILDEPINGLDPQGIIEIRELILKLNQEYQITVLISSHILDELSRLATHYGFIDKGKLIKEISAEELNASCSKYTHVEVTNPVALVSVLEKNGIQYEVTSVNGFNIYADISFTKLAIYLMNLDCEIISLTVQNDSLESFFINLVGGANHD